jgi:hypothetical protein
MNQFTDTTVPIAVIQVEEVSLQNAITNPRQQMMNEDHRHHAAQDFPAARPAKIPSPILVIFISCFMTNWSIK